MLLLSWHGTLVCLRGEGGGLSHETIEVAAPLDLELPPGAPAGSLRVRTALGPLEVQPAPSGRGVWVSRFGQFLCANLHTGEADFDRAEASHWETFLPVTAQDVAVLRQILGYGRLDHAGAEVEPFAPVRIAPGFRLKLEDDELDLVEHLPLDGAEAAMTSTESVPAATGDGWKQFMSGLTHRERKPKAVQLGHAGEHRQIAEVATEAAFKAGSNRRWRLPPQTELISSPLFISDDDWHWAYARFWQPGNDPPAGRLTSSCRLGRARDVGVVLARFGEGTLFDEEGVINDRGYLQNLQKPLPPGLVSENGSLSLDMDVFRNAPLLKGSHIVFVNGNLQNYYHWLLDSLVALDIMRQYAPPDAKLLIPGTVAQFRARPINGFDHLAVLRAMGLDDREIQAVPEHVKFARLEEAIWLDDHYVETLPGSHLRAIRDRLLAGRDRERPRRRICIRRTRVRGLANPEKIEGFLEKNGFSFHELEGMPPEAQIALFQDADFVVAPHGAGLVNMMFCSPRTRVLELSPDKEFRPFFWLMSNKLGLSHGVLPSPTHDGSFNGMMNVNFGRFRRMYQMLSAR